MAQIRSQISAALDKSANMCMTLEGLAMIFFENFKLIVCICVIHVNEKIFIQINLSRKRDKGK